MNFIKKSFEIGFKRDYVTELTELITHADILSGRDIAENLSSAVIPIALSLVSLWWILELLDKTIKYESSGLGWEQIMMLAIKLFIATNIVISSPTIMKTLLSISDYILEKVGVTVNTIQEIQFDELWNKIEEQGVVKQLISLIELLPIAITTMLISIIIRVAIYGRAVKLVLFSAFSPLPMSTIMFEEQRDISKRFLQNYGSALLQGAVILIIIILSNTLHQVSILGIKDVNSVSDISDIPGIFTRYCFINLTLLFALVKSESWTGKILGL